MKQDPSLRFGMTMLSAILSRSAFESEASHFARSFTLRVQDDEVEEPFSDSTSIDNSTA
jgi:hypothetical protein